MGEEIDNASLFIIYILSLNVQYVLRLQQFQMPSRNDSYTVGKKNATKQKLREVSSDLDLSSSDKAKNSSM